MHSDTCDLTRVQEQVKRLDEKVQALEDEVKWLKGKVVPTEVILDESIPSVVTVTFSTDTISQEVQSCCKILPCEDLDRNQKKL